jgi:hypothetical protein
VTPGLHYWPAPSKALTLVMCPMLGLRQVLHVTFHYLWVFSSNVNAKPLRHATRKSKWAVDRRPHNLNHA